MDCSKMVVIILCIALMALALPCLAQTREKRGDANVRDFGAKGDGKADDTAAIEAAWRTVCNVQKPEYRGKGPSPREYAGVNEPAPPLFNGAPPELQRQLLPGGAAAAALRAERRSVQRHQVYRELDVTCLQREAVLGRGEKEEKGTWFTSPTHRVGTSPWRHHSPGGAGGL